MKKRSKINDNINMFCKKEKILSDLIRILNICPPSRGNSGIKLYIERKKLLKATRGNHFPKKSKNSPPRGPQIIANNLQISDKLLHCNCAPPMPILICNMDPPQILTAIKWHSS